MIHPIKNTSPGYQTDQSRQSERAKQVEELKEEHQAKLQERISKMMIEVQSFLDIKLESPKIDVQEFKDFLQEIGYEGKPIGQLSQDEAAELISDEGFFGVVQTSDRIADFVLLGAGGDETLLREGREGILRGFKEAEILWGETLPDIAYETIEKAVQKIDQALQDSGYNLLDESI